MNRLFFLCLILLVLSGTLAFWPGLPGPLLMDDGPQILPIMHDIENGGWALGFGKNAIGNSGLLGRPVAMVSFIVNAGLSGDDIWYWKLTNVLLHILCAVLVFLVTRALLRLVDFSSEHRMTLVSLLIAILWLVHPIQVGTVLYVVQRMTILSSLFVFAGLWLFLTALQHELDGKNGRWFFAAALLVCLPLAVLSKENGVLLPVFVLLVSHYAVGSERFSSVESRRRVRRFDWLMGAIIVAGIGVFAWFSQSLFLKAYDFRDFTLVERLLTEARVVFLYLYQILLPIPANLGFFHDDIVLSSGLLKPITTLFSLVALLVLLCVLLISRRRLGLFGFGLLFFFASQLLESTVLPLEIAFEHRNYVGLWGIVLSLAVVMARFRIGLPMLLVLTLIAMGLTWQRASIWSDRNTLYAHIIETHPNSLRIRIIHADAYAQAGRFDEAYGYLRAETGLGAELHRLEFRCREHGFLADGELTAVMPREGSGLGTYELDGLIKLANLGLDGECRFDERQFIALLDRLSSVPIHGSSSAQKLWLYKAHYHHAIGDDAAAFEALERSFDQASTNPIPLFLKLEWQIERGDIGDAGRTYQRAKRVADEQRRDYSGFVQRTGAMLEQARVGDDGDR